MNTIDNLIKLAVDEDLGTGDITTDSLIPDKMKSSAKIIAKEDFILAGIEIAKKVFLNFDENIKFLKAKKDGAGIKQNDCVMELFGKTKGLLKAERIALNFLQKLSGIATNTNSYVQMIKNYNVKLVDTRKTSPGWRVLEKYAVKVGGAYNHRMGLYDGVLIKDNHIAASGSIKCAIEKIKKEVHHLIKIEVEVSSIEQVQEALNSKADVIMLDNMKIDEIKKSVKLINKRALVEVSGNITKDTIKEIAKTGVDIISSGSLTHQAVSVDISMRIF